MLIIFSALLRFSFLARKPFWFDECFSVVVARLGWGDFGRLLWRREANMSLYYLLLRGWLHFGSTPFFIRTLSVIFSLATVPAVYWLAGKLFDRRVALIAAALMSCNAYQIRYAQEARSYSLFLLLAILSSGFLITMLRETPARSSTKYILSGILAVYAHLYALLLLAAQCLWVRSSTRNSARALRPAWMWIAAASLPLIVFAAKTGAGPIRWIPRPGFYDVLMFAEHFAGNNGLTLLLLYLAACTLTLLPPARTPDGKHGEVWRLKFLLLWLLFPIGLALLLSLARPLFLGRYFIFCLPPLIVLAAAGLAKLRPAWLSALGLTAVLLLSLQGVFNYYDHDFDLDRDASGAAANYIFDHAQPGDAILFHIAEARGPYEFFKSLHSASAQPSAIYPAIVYPRHGDRLDYRDFTGKPSPELVQSLKTSYPRLWVVLMDNGTPNHADDSTLMLDEKLGQSYSRSQLIEFAQVEVRLYERSESAK